MSTIETRRGFKIFDLDTGMLCKPGPGELPGTEDSPGFKFVKDVPGATPEAQMVSWKGGFGRGNSNAI